MSMLGQLSPNKGNGLPVIPRPLGSPTEIGAIVYAATAPNTSYLLADGRSVKATDYPTYAKKFGQGPGYFTQRLTDPATLPTADISGYATAVSPNGRWFACASTGSFNGINIYKLTDDAAVFIQTLSPGTLAGKEGMAFSNDGEYLVVGITAAPYFIVYRRGVGVDTYAGGLTISGMGLSAVPTAVDITDDNVIMLAYNNSGFGYMGLYQISGNTYTRLAFTATTGVFPGALASNPLQIVRNKAGTRYAFRVSVSPYVYTYDYAGGEAWTKTSGITQGAPLADVAGQIAMSPNGDIATPGPDSQNITIFREISPGTYGRTLGTTYVISASVAYTADSRQFIASNGLPSNMVILQPANGRYLDLAKGNVGGYPSPFSYFKIARGGRVLVFVASSAPYLHFYTAASSMVDVPLPAYPTIGGGDTPLNPYIRVK